jgi:hypothetical protein
MDFEAFAFAIPIILNLFVSDIHSLQTGSLWIAKVHQIGIQKDTSNSTKVPNPVKRDFTQCKTNPNFLYGLTIQNFCNLSPSQFWGRVRDGTSKTTIFADMTDVHSTATRSYNMSRIKGKDISPKNWKGLRLVVIDWKNQKTQILKQMPAASHVYRINYVCENSTPAGVAPSISRFISINIQIRWI